MKLPTFNSLLLAFAATATLLPATARADRWDDRDDRDDWHHHRRVIVVERERRAPSIPTAIWSDHSGFVISPYSGALLDVRGVKHGSICYDFSAKGAPYICP